jgi:hypothetical protein
MTATSPRRTRRLATAAVAMASLAALAATPAAGAGSSEFLESYRYTCGHLGVECAGDGGASKRSASKARKPSRARGPARARSRARRHTIARAALSRPWAAWSASGEPAFLAPLDG